MALSKDQKRRQKLAERDKRRQRQQRDTGPPTKSEAASNLPAAQPPKQPPKPSAVEVLSPGGLVLHGKLSELSRPQKIGLAGYLKECMGITDKVAQIECGVVLEILDEGRTVAKLIEVGRNAVDWATWGCMTLGEQLNLEPPVCREGCHWCCRLSVIVTAPEVLYLAEYVRQTFDADRLASLRERLASVEKEIQGMDPVARARHGPYCALLVDGRCTAYDARPVKCRSWFSYDVEACERGDSVRVPLPLVSNGEGVQSGLEQGLKRAGLAGARYELTAALRIALDVPDAAGRYLAGEPVFDTAKCAP
jgi:hypothetical protein